MGVIITTDWELARGQFLGEWVWDGIGWEIFIIIGFPELWK